MRLIKIEKLKNGGHDNQTIDHISKIPNGWAVIPDDMETPSFPFGDITVKDIDGVPTVTSWTAGEMPEPTPEAEEEPSVEERVAILEQETEELSEALTMILEGAVE